MTAIRLPFDASRNISGSLALLLVAVIACLAAWLLLSVGHQIIENTESSPLVNIDQRSSDTGQTLR